MYVDKQLEFSDGQAVTSTAISTNVYDILSVTTGGATLPTVIGQNARMDLGIGWQDLWFIARTSVAATDVGSDATLIVTLETADDAALTTNATVIATSGTLAFAAFSPAGSQLLQTKLPSVPGGLRRYIGFRYTVASGPLTAGNFDAFATLAVQANTPYKSGFTVQ